MEGEARVLKDLLLFMVLLIFDSYIFIMQNMVLQKSRVFVRKLVDLTVCIAKDHFKTIRHNWYPGPKIT